MKSLYKKLNEIYNRKSTTDLYRHYKYVTLKAQSRKHFCIYKKIKLTSDLIYSEIINDLDNTTYKLRKRLGIAFA